MASCGRCGATSEAPAEPDQVGAQEVPLGWMLEVDTRAGRRAVICPACAREHVRAIEGKLDQAWW